MRIRRPRKLLLLVSWAIMKGSGFEQDIHDMFYGARQFGLRDLNGYILYFIQPAEG